MSRLTAAHRGQKALLRIGLTHKSERLAWKSLLLHVGKAVPHKAGAGARARLLQVGRVSTVGYSSLGGPRPKLHLPITRARISKPVGPLPPSQSHTYPTASGSALRLSRDPSAVTLTAAGPKPAARFGG